ncbi:lipoma-preferred partner [Silurus asotus]|uniref:Lipoma-preferred partner n=1 Tax=Silurus asotus TaxID=30991 RepID=A0AAD5B758_SILAS|nr:lipoma-preferred partner [Silurus asotus]
MQMQARSFRTMWSDQNNGSQHGHVTARMETSLPMGTPSISVSQHQAPKKFAPVVAPKPKFNPYKAPGDSTHDIAGDYPLPPPPVVDTSGMASSSSFPPPPQMDESSFGFQIKGPEKTLEERRSSLDAEIDSLTSILADLESSSPYKSRSTQNSATLPASPSTPVTGYKRMVIPNQPPLTATKKSTPKPQAPPSAAPASSPTPSTRPQQPVPASYSTASTPSQPTFSVQARAAQPGPQQQHQQPARATYAQGQYTPSQPRAPDFAYGPPQPTFTSAGGYHEQHYGGPPGLGGQNTWRAEPSHHSALPQNQSYQPPAPKKTYITDPPASMAPYGAGVMGAQKYETDYPLCATPNGVVETTQSHRLIILLQQEPPEEEEEEEGRCASCGENVLGEGTGCTAMDQVFHVDCFVCMTCSSKLRGKPFYAVEKKAYCEPCYINTLETCNICSKPIMERILRATGKAYHPHCFTCVVCHRSLDGVPFTVDASNHIHCIEDFHKKFAPRCSVCKEPIMPAPGQEETVRIVALDRDFHVQCYRCEDCGCLLSEGDNQGCYPLDGHVLCKNCNTSRIQALTAKATTDL